MNRQKAGWVVVALAWFCSGLAFAGNDVVVTPHWQKGEKVAYTLNRTRAKQKPGENATKVTTHTGVTMEVIEVGDKGMVVGWTFGETTFDDPKMAANPIAQKTANLVKGLRVELDVDPAGKLRGVRNWEALKSKAIETVAVLTDELKAAGADPKVVETVRTQSLAMFATKEQFEPMITREAQIWFMPFGVNFDGGRPVEYADQLANVLGGEAFPSTARFVYTGKEAGSGLVGLSWTQTVDPKEAGRIMEKSLKAMATRLGRPPEGIRVDALTIADSADFTIDPVSGWIGRANYTRVTRLNDSAQEDSFSFVRNPP